MEKKQKSSSEIHKNHRARMKETYLKSGFSAFSDIEKLEFILFYAVSRKDTNPIAHKLIDEFGSFDKVLEAPIEKLVKIEGLGEHSAILLTLLLQATSEYGKDKCASYIHGTSSAKEYCKNLFMGKFNEEFYVICIDNNNKVVNTKLINTGNQSEVNIDIREITKLAINTHSNRIILAHNHPQGKARPSDEDIAFTSKIMFSCLINDIEILDHIIVSQDAQFSLEESTMLREIKRDSFRRIPFAQIPKSVKQKTKEYKCGK